MTPVEQTKFGRGGNCFEACVASILDLQMWQMPGYDMAGDTDAFRRWNSWLGSKFGLVLVAYPPDVVLPGEYVIISGKSPREEGLFHAVVGLNNQVVWDPHPGRHEPIGDLWDVIKLTPAEKVLGWGWPVMMDSKAFNEMKRKGFVQQKWGW